MAEEKRAPTRERELAFTAVACANPDDIDAVLDAEKNFWAEEFARDHVVPYGEEVAKAAKKELAEEILDWLVNDEDLDRLTTRFKERFNLTEDADD